MIATAAIAQGVIDVHSHIITPDCLAALQREGRLMDKGFPLPRYDVQNHLRWMDEAGVQTSILTLAALPQPSSRPPSRDLLYALDPHRGLRAATSSLPTQEDNIWARPSSTHYSPS